MGPDPKIFGSLGLVLGLIYTWVFGFGSGSNIYLGLLVWVWVPNQTLDPNQNVWRRVVISDITLILSLLFIYGRYSGSNSEIEHWMRYLDEALSDNEESNNGGQNPSNLDLMMLEIGGGDGHSSGMSVDANNNNSSFGSFRAAAPENQLYQPALLAATKLNNFVHVLYTLSLLLIGKERKQVDFFE